MSKTIPIKNIYYMLCYAWNVLDRKDIVDVDSIDSTELIDLFARVLDAGIRQLIKQGWTRNYVSHHEVIPGIKGKIDFNGSLKRMTFRNGRSVCFFDEFSNNNLHNQIIKTTMNRLIRMDNIDKNNKAKIHDLMGYFHGIDIIELRMNHFSRVRINRNNRLYRFLIDICKIICNNTMIDEKSGNYKFSDFSRDKGMPNLFEKFILNFYKKHLESPRYHVKSEVIYWDFENEDFPGKNYIPQMETDISIVESGKRKIIIDTKFYGKTIYEHWETERVRSDHLYQIFSYLINGEKKDDGLGENAKGILLYPVVDRDVYAQFIVHNHVIQVSTIDLNQDWKNIKEELEMLISDDIIENT